MEHAIKTLAEAITHKHTRSLVESHVKELSFENNHLMIYVDNAGPLHELSDKETEEHLRKALEEIYGVDSTYEFKIYKGFPKGDKGERFFGNIK